MSLDHNFKSIADMPEKWVKAILVIVGLQYLRLLYIDISSMDIVLRCVDCPFRIVSLLSYLDLLYLPVVFILFYKRLRWGWIVLFGSKLFTIVPSLIYYLHDYLPMAGASVIPPFLFGVIFNIIVLVLLWKSDITSTFKVNAKTRLFTVLMTFLIILLVSLPRIMS